MSKVSRKVKLAILGTGILSFCGSLMMTALNVAFPTLMNQFHISLSTVQWLTSATMLASCITMFTTAMLYKKIKLKTIFEVAVSLFIINIILALGTPNFGILLLARIIGGISTGLCTPLIFTLIIQNVPSEFSGRYMSLGSLAVAVAPTIGPTFGGLVINYFNWKWIFLFILPFAILSLILGAINIPQAEKPQKITFDWFGFGLVAGFVTLFLLGISKLNIPIIGNIILLGMSLILLALYIKHSKKAPKPLFNIGVFKNKLFTLFFATYFLLQLTNISLGGFVVPNMAQLAMHATAMVAGLIVLPGSLLRLVFIPLSGRILDEQGPVKPMIIGFTINVIFFIALVMAVPKLTPVWVMIAYLFYNVGFSLTFSNAMTLGINSLPKEVRSNGNAIFNAFQQYSGAIGTTIVSFLMNLGKNAHPGTLGMRLGSRFSLSFLMITTIIGFIAVLTAFKLKKKDD